MAYPLPGFGRDPFLDGVYDQHLQTPPPSATVTAPSGMGSMSKQQTLMFNSSYLSTNHQSSTYPAKFDYTYRSSPSKRRPQTPHQAAMANAERIVHDPQLWQGFKAMIRERRNDVALPTTNLLTVEYLHKFVEHQFELEAERMAHEEAMYDEIQRRYESADSYYSKSDKEYGDGRITLQKAAKWLTESFSQLSLNNVEREKEAAVLAAAFDEHRKSQQQSSALAMSRRTTMSISSSSIESDEEHSDNEVTPSSNNNSFSDSLSSILKEAAQFAVPTSPLIPKEAKLSQRRRAQWDSPFGEELIDEDEYEMEERFATSTASSNGSCSSSSSSSSTTTQPRPYLLAREGEEENSRRGHFHSNPRPPQPPQGPPPSTSVSPRSSNGGGRRRHSPDQYDNPILPASRGVPLAGILEYGEQDYEYHGPGGDDPRGSASSHYPVPPQFPPVSFQEQTPSWGPRAA